MRWSDSGKCSQRHGQWFQWEVHDHGVISKINSGTTVEGFRIANAREILNIDLLKVSVCTPRLFI